MGTDTAALERRIRRIEDREAIRVLAGRYALAMDNKDFDLVAELFAPDARFGWIDGAFAFDGREAIVAMYRDRLKDAGPSFHYTHDQIVEWNPADDDRATGLVLGHAETSSGPAQSLVAIRYHDRYVRRDGRWLFQERLLAFLYNTPVAQYDGILMTPDRIRLPTGSKRAHWP
jgi:uncharacterized protein (TIGR02246 family)